MTKVWGLKKILVVCPSSAFSAWERDAKKCKDLSLQFVTGTKEERLRVLGCNLNVYVINYEGLKTVFANFVPNTDGNGKHWQIDPSSFKYKFDCIIFDEVHKCSDYSSLQSSICCELSKRATHVIGLTGTPIDKSMLDLFNVYKVIDLGGSLGSNFFAYRNAYFKETWHNWVPKEGCKKKILQKLSGITVVFDRKECFDLPELQEDVITVPPTQEFLDLQRSIIDGEVIKINGHEYESEKKDDIDGSCKWDVPSKLRELSGGFLYFKQEDENVPERLKSNPKLDALLDIIDDSHNKIVVFHQFIEAAGFIEEVLKKHKIKFVSVRGGQKQSDRQIAIKRFAEDESVKVMLAHPACAAEGWDGSAADTVVFYDEIAGPRVYDQCVGRIWRKGQTKPCLVLSIHLDKSIDKTIAKNRKNDISLVQSVMEYLKVYDAERRADKL